MEMMLRMFLLAALMLAVVSADTAAAKPVTFVFGDSLTEVGNNNYLQSLAKANYPYYGIDYEGGRATGRFTNGRTIGDIICTSVFIPYQTLLPPCLSISFIFFTLNCCLVLMEISCNSTRCGFAAEKLGIPSPPPYLSLAPNDDKFLEGVNYASGGAGILNDTGLYFVIISPSPSTITLQDGPSKYEQQIQQKCLLQIQRLSFDDQIESFNKTKQAIVGKIGQAAADRFSNKALYFIGIGSNDYVNNFLQPFLPDGLQYTHDEFVELLASTLEKQLKRLYKLGARKMIVHGLGPLGCIPSQRMKSTTGGCLKKVNQWVLEFNAQVQNLTTSLGRQLPKSQVVFADTYNAVLDLITKPSTYGFKISNTSCCNVDTKLGGLCSPNSKVCQNRHDYVFWDSFHPSDAANAVLANYIFTSLFTKAPSPAPAPK
ncbi:hypothetical protein SAY87_007547 [Trapa incisa]|uniref:GDSL esterase/lipase n=1 Tax=Trapa incisa TaxID=236973 RepID=A0AAN7QID9_9MYRT|nr:hypothetical protein SAY87_007547 [Trapa incisa]